MPKVVLNKQYLCKLRDTPWYNVVVVPMFKSQGFYTCFVTGTLQVSDEYMRRCWRTDGLVSVMPDELEEYRA